MPKNKKIFAAEKIAILKSTQEKELLKIAQEGKIEIEKLEKELAVKEDLSPKEKKIIQQKIGKIGQERARAIRLLIYCNQHLVKYIARGYFSASSDVDYEDLVSEGIISLTKAIEKFELNSPNRFATYAGY